MIDLIQWICIILNSVSILFNTLSINRVLSRLR